MKKIKWTDEEDKLLRDLFKKFSLSREQKKSKLLLIHQIFQGQGYNRTPKAIKLRAYNIGLRNYRFGKGTIQVVHCKMCGMTILRKKVSKTGNYCTSCQYQKKLAFQRTPEIKKRMREYMKEWKKKT